jgi:hypothetical protein
MEVDTSVHETSLITSPPYSSRTSRRGSAREFVDVDFSECAVSLE